MHYIAADTGDDYMQPWIERIDWDYTIYLILEYTVNSSRVQAG
jgi:hypothetical protein